MDIGFQLFSARNYPLEAVLRKISDVGYRHVEGYSSLYADVDGFKQRLDDAGLCMPTAHLGLDELRKPDETLRLAEKLGIKVLVCPWIPPELRPTTMGGWIKFGRELQEIAQPYAQAGLSFAYHNHDFEFATIDGKYAMDMLLEAAPAVSVEADVAWIVRGKADPALWLPRFGDRVVAIHVKDIAPAGQNADEGGWADAGHGVVPWTALWTVIRNNTRAKYFIAEHDDPNDIDRFATRAYAFINSLGAK